MLFKRLKSLLQKLTKKVNKIVKLKEESRKKLKKIVGLAVLLLVFLMLAWRFKHLFFVAFVNGRPITRLSLDRQLEKRFGQQELESQVSQALILQAAQKEGIKVAQTEVDEKIKELEEQFQQQGMDLKTLLAGQGQTKNELIEQIKVQLTVEKILSQDIDITDEEIAAYYEENKASFAEVTSLEEMKDDLYERLRQQKIGEKFQPWLEELRDQAKIRYFLNF